MKPLIRTGPSDGAMQVTFACTLHAGKIPMRIPISFQLNKRAIIVSASHHRCSQYGEGQPTACCIIYSCKHSTARGHKSHDPAEILRLCLYMGTGMRGCICFPQKSQRMLIRAQGFSRDSRKIALFYFIFISLSLELCKTSRVI